MEYGPHKFWFWNKAEEVFEEMLVASYMTNVATLSHEPTNYILLKSPSIQMKQFCLNLDKDHRDILVFNQDRKWLDEHQDPKEEAAYEELGFQKHPEFHSLERIILVFRESSPLYQIAIDKFQVTM